MKRFLMAVAVAVLSASVVSADEKPTTGTKPATPATPAATPATGTPIVDYSTTDAPRRGLFSRLRSGNGVFGRRATSSYTPAPVVTPPVATPMPMPGTTPTPMPPVKPAAGTTTSGKVVPATGTLPAGRYTTTDGTIVQVGGTTTSGSRIGTGTTTTGTRGSFLSRLRAR
ncbi:MAG: hypothetical protein FJ304_00465 [Planctomycetes bacterium]|nr:hypothetical protein [Planctomycetota bacterium]